MGLFDGLKNIVKKVAGVLDNPLSRALGTVTGTSGYTSGIAALADNRKAIGTMSAPVASIGAATPQPWMNIALPAGARPMALTSLPVAYPGVGGGGPVASMTTVGGVRAARRMVPRFNKFTRSWEWAPAARRMNPMNVRAARRAVRRIRGAMKLLKRIERTLPKQRTSKRRVA